MEGLRKEREKKMAEAQQLARIDSEDDPTSTFEQCVDRWLRKLDEDTGEYELDFDYYMEGLLERRRVMRSEGIEAFYRGRSG